MIHVQTFVGRDRPSDCQAVEMRDASCLGTGNALRVVGFACPESFIQTPKPMALGWSQDSGWFTFERPSSGQLASLRRGKALQFSRNEQGCMSDHMSSALCVVIAELVWGAGATFKCASSGTTH